MYETFAEGKKEAEENELLVADTDANTGSLSYNYTLLLVLNWILSWF